MRLSTFCGLRRDQEQLEKNEIYTCISTDGDVLRLVTFCEVMFCISDGLLHRIIMYNNSNNKNII
jgi:hypothetical protein